MGEQLMQIEPLFGVIKWLQGKCLLKLRHKGDQVILLYKQSESINLCGKVWKIYPYFKI